MNDPEMKLWQEEWSKTKGTAAAPLLDEIVAAAVRYQRRSHLALAANFVFAMLLLAGSLLVAERAHSREIVLWAVCVWLTTLIASYFALEGWRKSRLHPIESVADYARFHRKRAIADQWMVRSGIVLLCVQDTIACVWLTTDLFRIRIPLSRFAMAMAVLSAVSLLWAYLFRRMWRRAAVILETNRAENAEPQAD